MGRAKKKYALIWWVDTHHKDVIELNRIKKAEQKIGCVTTLKWDDGQKNTSIHRAKVIMIGGTYMDLP